MGSVNTSSNDCGRMEGTGLTSKDWKAFTKELTTRHPGQYICHSFRIYPHGHKKIKKDYGGWPSLTWKQAVEQTHQKRQDMIDAGWKELDLYPGNHVYNGDTGESVYYMCLMGLVIKPDRLKNLLVRSPLFEEEEKEVLTITAPVMKETMVQKVKRVVKKRAVKRTTTKKETA
jgi:hypothetical protein